jgi:hypothetical protein
LYIIGIFLIIFLICSILKVASLLFVLFLPILFLFYFVYLFIFLFIFVHSILSHSSS